MSTTKRANRLQANVREDLLECIESLNKSRRTAKVDNDNETASKYASKIEDILDMLDEMSELALADLNDDDETLGVVRNLGEISEELEKRSAEMKETTEKLTKAAEVIDTAASFISGVSGLLV